MTVSQLAQFYVFFDENIPDTIQQKLIRQKPQKPSPKQEAAAQALQRNFPSNKVTTEPLIGAWFADLLLEVDNHKIIIELDGSQHYGADGRLRYQDGLRDNWLRAKGYIVIRIKNENYCEKSLLQKINHCLRADNTSMKGNKNSFFTEEANKNNSETGWALPPTFEKSSSHNHLALATNQHELPKYSTTVNSQLFRPMKDRVGNPKQYKS